MLKLNKFIKTYSIYNKLKNTQIQNYMISWIGLQSNFFFYISIRNYDGHNKNYEFDKREHVEDFFCSFFDGEPHEEIKIMYFILIWSRLPCRFYYYEYNPKISLKSNEWLYIDIRETIRKEIVERYWLQWLTAEEIEDQLIVDLELFNAGFFLLIRPLMNPVAWIKKDFGKRSSFNKTAVVRIFKKDPPKRIYTRKEVIIIYNNIINEYNSVLRFGTLCLALHHVWYFDDYKNIYKKKRKF